MRDVESHSAALTFAGAKIMHEDRVTTSQASNECQAARRRRVGVWLGVTLVLICAPAALADVYFVRSSGEDANSGRSPEEAWASVEHAADQLEAGDIVYVGAGTYVGEIRPRHSGTVADPIRYIADLNGTHTGDAGTVTLVTQTQYVIRVDRRDHLQFDGFDIAEGHRGMRVDRSGGILIRHCTIRGNSGDGLRGERSSIELEQVVVHSNGGIGIDIGRDSEIKAIDLTVQNNGSHGVRMRGPGTRYELDRWRSTENENGVSVRRASGTMTNGLIVQNDGHGIEAPGHHGEVQNIIHVTVASNRGHGVYLHHGDSRVRNSIIAFNEQTGIHYKGRPGKGPPGKGHPGKGHPGKGHPGKGPPGKGHPGHGPPGKGHPGKGPPGHGSSGDSDQDAGVTSTNNLIFANGGGHYFGVQAGPGDFHEDPQFVSMDEFRLAEQSPAVAAADGSYAPGHDLNGHERPTGDGPDLGCFEYVGEQLPTVLRWREISQ